MNSVTVSTVNIVLVVLAAGESKRMGKAKQLLPWRNKTLIEHAIETALKVRVKKVVVVLGANHLLIKNKIKNYPIEIIVNSEWSNGLGSSICRAVSKLRGAAPNLDGLMFILADQPFVTSDYLMLMLGKFQANKNQILTTKYKDRKHGVPTIFDRNYFEELSNVSGDGGAHSIVKKYNNFVSNVDAPFDNKDIDTTEDYERALKIISKK